MQIALRPSLRDPKIVADLCLGKPERDARRQRIGSIRSVDLQIDANEIPAVEALEFSSDRLNSDRDRGFVSHFISSIGGLAIPMLRRRGPGVHRVTRPALALLPILALAGCTDPDGSRDVLEAAGYSEVRIVERPHWWTSNCGERDTYATPFTAEGPTGIPVEGVVCSQGAYGKGATIRITRVNRPARATGLPLMPGSTVR